MITCVPMWVHVPIVLVLLCLHAATFHMMKRRIETLQMALVARRALLNEKVAHDSSTHLMAAGDTLSLKRIPADRINITVSTAVSLNVVYIR